MSVQNNLEDHSFDLDAEWNPVSVERAILSIVNDKAKAIITSKKAYEDYLDKSRAYKKAYARAYMAHKGPQTEKKVAANVVAEVEAAEIDRDAAEVAYKYARDLSELLSEKLEAMRSVGVSVRKAYENTGRGEW